MTIQTLILKIEDMSCQACVKSVTNAILQVNGVQDCVVNLDNHQASVTYDDTLTDVKTLQSVVEELGFDVKSVQ